MRGVDIFDLYRVLLLIAGGTYTIVRTMMALSMLLSLPEEAGPRWRRTLRIYLATQLLRTRLRRFALELLQMLVLLVVLGWLAYLNVVRL
jgi:hypothetical protein